MALVASTSQRGKTRKSLGRLSPKIPPSRACNAFCQWSVRGKDQIRELPPSASEASYHEACPSAKTPLAWILIYFKGLDFKHWLFQQSLPIWNKGTEGRGGFTEQQQLMEDQANLFTRRCCRWLSSVASLCKSSNIYSRLWVTFNLHTFIGSRCRFSNTSSYHRSSILPKSDHFSSPLF